MVTEEVLGLLLGENIPKPFIKQTVHCVEGSNNAALAGCCQTWYIRINITSFFTFPCGVGQLSHYPDASCLLEPCQSGHRCGLGTETVLAALVLGCPVHIAWAMILLIVLPAHRPSIPAMWIVPTEADPHCADCIVTGKCPKSFPAVGEVAMGAHGLNVNCLQVTCSPWATSYTGLN